MYTEGSIDGLTSQAIPFRMRSAATSNPFDFNTPSPLSNSQTHNQGAASLYLPH
ncbi:hypothetical protein TUMEXPCC7403_08595 [Tumidithrix helvetica PCC 7403]